jgi:protoheme IX farnesyltransferase
MQETIEERLPGSEIGLPHPPLGFSAPAVGQAAGLAGWLSLASGLWHASRPRIVAMVLFTMTVTALVAAPQPPAWTVLANALVGSALVIVGAIALNQRLEYISDGKMPRTANRPLPSGRLTNRQMTTFGIVTTAAGLVYLALLVNTAIVLLAAISWVIYVWIYTPSKRLTPWQTAVGAVAGAMPTLLGAAAADASLSPNALALFGTVYFWQFPHAMAIAWVYRDQFASAEVKLPTVIDPSGRSAGLLSLMGAVALVPVSLMPVMVGAAGWGYAAVALLLDAAYLLPAIRFLARPEDAVARRLLVASFFYLPAALAAQLVALLW